MKLLFAYKRRAGSWGIDRALRWLEQQGHAVCMHRMNIEEWVELLREPRHDVVLVDQALASRALADPCIADLAAGSAAPLVLIEAVDGSQLGLRGCLKWSSLVATLKRSVLRPASLHNEVGGRYHEWLLIEAGVTDRRTMQAGARPKVQLSETELAKIYPLHGFGSHPRLDRAVGRDIDFLAPRSIDAHFLGTVSYEGSPIEAHRKLALRTVQQWGDRYGGSVLACGGRPLRLGRYQQSLRDSKCVLSPWGCGETCHRDFEAMLAGCVLIKPDMRHVGTWPETFRPHETYIPCRPDFSDVHEIINRVRAIWGAYEGLRRRARQTAIEGRRPENIATRLLEILEEVL